MIIFLHFLLLCLQGKIGFHEHASYTVMEQKLMYQELNFRLNYIQICGCGLQEMCVSLYFGDHIWLLQLIICGQIIPQKIESIFTRHLFIFWYCEIKKTCISFIILSRLSWKTPITTLLTSSVNFQNQIIKQ